MALGECQPTAASVSRLIPRTLPALAPDPSVAPAKSESTIPRLDQHPDTAYPSTQSSSFPSQSPASAVPSSLSAQSSFHPTMQEDTNIAQSAPSPTPDTLGAVPSGAPSPAPAPSPSLDVDPQIIEALRSKDRIYVLKLGEMFEALIMERRQRVEISPATSYQRLLVHRCSAYYKLAPESDPVTKGIFVLTTAESRIPDRRISELVPAESTAQPAFKIMRRSVLDRRSKAQSHAGSVAGEDQELSDHEQSESGSLGGQSSATNSSNKKRMTIAEREAAYNEARSRIFMGFEEKSKEKDMSASSSTLSLNGSASTSAGGRSSVGDTEDAVSSPATESEWSVPSGSNSRDKRDGRRGPNSASASSSRSLRNQSAFHGNSSGGSSRNSRAASPSFSYASLHDTPMGGHMYDPAHPTAMSSYYPAQYAYPYPPPPAQGPAPPFVPQYQYYPQHYNAYQSPPPVPQHNSSDPPTPASAEPYSPPHMGYMPHYGWPPHSQPPPVQSPPPHTMHVALPPTQPPQNSHPVGPGPPPAHPPHPQYHPYPPPVHAYSYPMGTYYPPPPPPPNGQQMPPPPPPTMPVQQHPPQPSQHSHFIGQPQPQPQHPHQSQHAQPPQQLPQNLHEYAPRGGMNNNALNHSPHGHYNNNNNQNGPRNGLGNGVISPNNNGRVAPRNGGSGPGMNNGNGGYNGAGNNKQQRGPPPPPAPQRSAWSYGPGVTGISQGSGLYTPMPHSASETVGPRLNISRRTSGNSSSGSNSRASSNCDEVSSTSSTTSSSSRRTYTSTTSSQHPLPPRPDWAVGLKAQPTLAGGPRHHDVSSRNLSPISPPRMSSNGHNSPIGRMSNDVVPRVTLEPQDFPPLTTSGEKKTPVVTGAWGVARPVLSPSMNVNISPSNAGTAAAPQQQQTGVSSPAKQEENDVTIRGSEPVNAKLVKRPTAAGANGASNFRDAVLNESPNPVAGLAGQVAAISLEGNGVASGTSGENGASAGLASLDDGSSSAVPPVAATVTA